MVAELKTAEPEPYVGPTPDGTWTPAGNIKGPPGSGGAPPDPLVVGVVQANTKLQVGTSFRIIPNLADNGALIQTSADGGATWTLVAAFP
jgi:hypothetical protein